MSEEWRNVRAIFKLVEIRSDAGTAAETAFSCTCHGGAGSLYCSEFGPSLKDAASSLLDIILAGGNFLNRQTPSLSEAGREPINDRGDSRG